MGAGHAHALHVHGHSRLHRLPPECKLVAAVGFVAAVAVTPREAVWAFVLYGALVATLAVVAGVRARFLLTRLVVVVPFLLSALLVPFVAGGEQVQVGGVALSVEGLWGSWNIAAKAVLGASTSILLAATTEVPRLLTGLTRLRVPVTLTTIAAFMVRYLEVLTAELGRSRRAMLARGYDPRWLWQVRPLATSAGAMFVRSYERGERVHAAMLARGYTGAMPVLDERRATPRDWLGAALLPTLGVAVADHSAQRHVTAAVSVRDVWFSYPDGTTVLRGLDLDVQPGERVALLGANGAGKTTLALHLNGLHEPDRGEVHIGGLRVAPDTAQQVRQKVGLVFQDADDQLFMPTVGEDVAFGPANLGLRGAERDARVREALTQVGALDLAGRAPHHLSGGERRRAALATVLAMRPDVLVLDEPTSGLDPAGRRELVDVLSGLPMTQLVVTHDLPFALELCDRSVIVSAGRIAADGADRGAARRRAAACAPTASSCRSASAPTSCDRRRSAGRST